MAEQPTRDIPELTVLLKAAWGKGGAAEDSLFAVLRPKLERRAARLLEHNFKSQRHDLSATDLVNLVYLRVRTTTDKAGGLHIQNRDHFFGQMVLAMKHVLLDGIKAGGEAKKGKVFVPLNDVDVRSPEQKSADIEALEEALEELKRISPRLAQALDMKYYLGLTHSEAAEMADLSVSTHKRDIEVAEQWVFKRLTRPLPKR